MIEPYRGKFRSVAEEIPENLHDAPAIGHDPRKVEGNVDAESLTEVVHPEIRSRPLNNRQDVDRLRFDGMRAGRGRPSNVDMD